MKFAPGPEEGGPVAMSQDDGASIDVIGRVVCSRALIMLGKGSRRGPEKENPRDEGLVGDLG